MKTLVCLVVCLSVCYGQFSSSWSCSYIERQDCYRYGDHPECGTDGVTYRNRCDYAKAHCANRDLHVASYGPCSSVSTTAAPGTGGTSGGGGSGPVLSGPDAAFDFLCIALSHSPCPTDLETLCGSDGVTYTNSCEFEKTRCTHRELTVTKYEKC